MQKPFTTLYSFIDICKYKIQNTKPQKYSLISLLILHRILCLKIYCLFPKQKVFVENQIPIDPQIGNSVFCLSKKSTCVMSNIYIYNQTGA